MSRSEPRWIPVGDRNHSTHNLGEAEASVVLQCEIISASVQAQRRGRSVTPNVVFTGARVTPVEEK